MAASAAPSEVADGPVLSLMSKRLRALRKKLNRILQMEENLAQGKPLNKEQEEVLRSKPSIVTLIDEYEKLRNPLSLALEEEHSLISSQQHQQPPPQPSAASDGDSITEDLIKLLYFGILFDVKPQSDFTSTMLTRTHERECCLTYDYVTDDATDLLGEMDLDLISTLGSLVISRPVHSGLSHKNALRSCIEHAKLWLSNSDQPIHPDAAVTYAGLRERLDKIMASDYFTATPEMKAPVDVAAAAGKYAPSQVPLQDLTSPSSAIEQDNAYQEQYQDKDEEVANFQGQENDANHDSIEDHPKDAVVDDVSPQQDQSNKLQADLEEPNGGPEQEQHYIPRRAYQNQRGGGRGGGGGRRGYPNGRGGRGGRGGNNYQNGRNQYYDSGNYYPRNYHNMRGRGAGGGRFGAYDNHGMSGHGHIGAGVESARS